MTNKPTYSFFEGSSYPIFKLKTKGEQECYFEEPNCFACTETFISPTPQHEPFPSFCVRAVEVNFYISYQNSVFTMALLRYLLVSL